ncbi:polysaccharide deacetylase family protein [Catenulispora yoronensis]
MSATELRNISFHGIGVPNGAEREPGEHRYWVTEKTFLDVLDECAKHPQVRLSFDDGNASDVDIALPALVERGLKADFFPIADRIGDGDSVDEQGLRALVAAGMTVGTHGAGHRAWTSALATHHEAELRAARTRISEAAGRPVDTAACPFGAYNRGVLKALRSAGYRTVFTSDARPAFEGSWLQPRYSVEVDDTAASVRERMLTPARSRSVLSIAVF